jgi:hypothetical protein
MPKVKGSYPKQGSDPKQGAVAARLYRKLLVSRSRDSPLAVPVVAAAAAAAYVAPGGITIEDPNMFYTNTELINFDRYKAFMTLRAKGLMADLVHDIGRKDLDALLGPPPPAVGVAIGGAGGGDINPVELLIRRIIRHINIPAGAPPNSLTLIQESIRSFYAQCTTDATAKSLYKIELEKYLSKYENIISMETFASKEYNNDTEETEFLNVLQNITPGGGSLAFYLDAQFGNIFPKYRKHKTDNRDLGLDDYLVDAAYIIDPGSGWDPRGIYNKTTRPTVLQIPAVYTSLGYNLRLDYINEHTVDATWEGRGMPPIRVTNSTSSVVSTYNECVRIINAADLVDGRTPALWEQIFDILLLKPAGDEAQGYAVSSTLWGDKPYRIIVTNDILASLYYLLFKRAMVLYTGTGYYKLYTPVALVGELTVEQKTALSRNIGIDIYRATFTIAYEHIRTLYATYSAKNEPRYTKIPLLADPATHPVESAVSINSNEDTYTYAVLGATSDIPRGISYIVDVLEKLYIYNEMVVKSDPANNLIVRLKEYIRDAYVNDFIGISDATPEPTRTIFRNYNAAYSAVGGNYITIPDAVALPMLSVIRINTEYLPLTSVHEFRKYLNLYGVFSQKASYKKFTNATSIFYDITRTIVKMIGSVPILINSVNIIFNLYRELKDILSGIVQNDSLTPSAIAFSITYVSYALTMPPAPVERISRTTEELRKSYIIEDRKRRIEWLSKNSVNARYFGIPDYSDITPNTLSQLINNIINTLYPEPGAAVPIDTSLFPESIKNANSIVYNGIDLKIIEENEDIDLALDSAARKLTFKSKRGGARELESTETDEDDSNIFYQPPYADIDAIQTNIDKYLEAPGPDSDTLAVLIADNILSAASLDEYASSLDILSMVGKFINRFNMEYGVTELKELVMELVNGPSIQSIRSILFYRLDELVASVDNVLAFGIERDVISEINDIAFLKSSNPTKIREFFGESLTDEAVGIIQDMIHTQIEILEGMKKQSRPQTGLSLEERGTLTSHILPGVERPAVSVFSGGARTARRQRKPNSPTHRRHNRKRRMTRRRKAPNLLRRLRSTRRQHEFRSDR